MMGFMIGSLSRATAWVNGCAFALVLFGEFLAVPQYHHPGNAAAFESMAYSVVLPLAMRACLVLGPALWGMRAGARRTMLRRARDHCPPRGRGRPDGQSVAPDRVRGQGRVVAAVVGLELAVQAAQCGCRSSYLIAAAAVASSSPDHRSRLMTRGRP